MKKLIGLLLIVILAVSVMVVRYTRDREQPVGFALSATDCSAHVSPIADGASESIVSEVECTARWEEIVIDQEDASSRHCVGQISPLEADDTTSPLRSVNCFATFADAVSHASGGTIHVDASITPESLKQALLNTQGTTATSIIGIMWGAAPYAASTDARTWTWTTDDSRMCNGASYAAPMMPGGWDDSVSSAHAYNNCNSYEHYEHAAFDGLMIDCRPACPAMGSMNDRTSSWRIRSQ